MRSGLSWELPTVRKPAPAVAQGTSERFVVQRAVVPGARPPLPLVCTHPTGSLARAVIGVESLMARDVP